MESGAINSSVAGPVASGARIQTLDVIRGAAVLGILLMNIWAFAGPQAYFDYPLAVADRAGSAVATWTVIHTLFEGSQRALFSLLFGAGMLLMVTRLAAKPGARVARIYYRRLFLLITIGLIDAFIFLWPADILITYGLCGLLLYPLRRQSTALLIGLALGVFVINAGLRVADLQEASALRDAYPAALTAPADDAQAQATVTEWEKIESRARPDPDSEKMQEGIRLISSGTFGEFFAERAKSSLILQTVVALNAWVLDALAMMLLGMAALRSGLLTGEVSRRTLWLTCLLGYGIGLPLAVADTLAHLGSGFDPIVSKQWLVVYDLRRGGVAAGHLGAMLLLCQSGTLAWLQARLACVGRMALSNYLAQSLLGALIFYTVGFGLFGQITGWYLYLFVGAIWLFLITLSNWWLTRYNFGPAEWLWRSLTYRQRQVLRRPGP
jgi:uncharacterized protein